MTAMSEHGGRVRRRTLFAAAGGVAAGAAGAVGANAAIGSGEGEAAVEALPTTVAFHGAHQAGVATPGQAHAVLLALELDEAVDRERFAAVMRLLSDDAERLTQGVPALADADPELAAVPDRLTVTFGFGLGLFERLGLGESIPAGLAPLPEFATDALEERWSGGDLLVQVCGDGELAVRHAVRMLVKDSRSFARVRWTQRGFRQYPPGGGTPRNVMGQIDGTANPSPSDPDFDAVVWAGPEPGWFAGGTVMVVRRIRVDLDGWDRLDATGKDRVIGRRLSDGAPLGGASEQDEPDLDAREEAGLPVIPANAHIRRAAVDGAAMLRRSYNYDEGPDGAGAPDSGLLFVSFQSDVARFVAVQERLAEADMLNAYASTVGSAVFAVPPGCEPGGWIGATLLG